MNSKFSFNLNTSSTGGAGNTSNLFGSNSSLNTAAATGTQQNTGPQQTTLNLFGFGPKTTTPATGTAATGSTLPGSTSFNTGFGQQQQQQNKPIGLGFNQTATNASPFGATTTQPANTSFSFGANQQPATTSTINTATGGFGGFGGFGGNTTQQQQQPVQSSFGGFGSTTTAAAATNQANVFSLNTTQPQNSLFSLNNQQQQQQQQQQQLQQQIVNQPPTTLQELDHLMNALVNAQVFNDERDLILAKWNQLQAFYGIGKIFYQNMSIDVTKDTRLTRFKTIGYSCKPLYKNEDGLVSLIINQKDTNVKTNQKNISDALFKIFNSDQSLIIKVDSIKQLAEDKTEFTFYVEQRLSPVNESLKSRVPAMQVFQHLNKQEGPATTTTSAFSLLGGGAGGAASSLNTKQTIKQQLEQISVSNFYPLVGLTDEQIKKYLDKPPAGFDHALWDQGKKKNPNPKKLLPVQIIGFQEINKRFKLQDQENHAQKITINLINDKIETVNSRNTIIKSKIEQFKARNEDLEQRILKILINYELRRKSGLPMQENEKYLSNILESYEIELSSPINKEIREQKINDFNEIIAQLENTASNDLSKRQTTSLSSSNGLNSQSQLSDLSNLTEVQKSLREQHLAFKSLIEIINHDMKDLNTIKRGLLNEK